MMLPSSATVKPPAETVANAGHFVQEDAGEEVGEPRRAPGAHPLEQALAVRGEGEADAAPVAFVADSLQEPGGLESVDVPGERGGGDPLLGGQLAQAHSGIAADQPEERHLPARHSELLGLLA